MLFKRLIGFFKPTVDDFIILIYPSFDLEDDKILPGQDFVILQIERWIDENNEIIDGWFEESDQPLKKH